MILKCQTMIIFLRTTLETANQACTSFQDCKSCQLPERTELFVLELDSINASNVDGLEESSVGEDLQSDDGVLNKIQGVN